MKSKSTGVMVIKSVINLKKPIDTPVINFAQPKALEKQITD